MAAMTSHANTLLSESGVIDRAPYILEITSIRSWQMISSLQYIRNRVATSDNP